MLRWYKVFTDRSPLGAFYQASTEEEARRNAERDGRGKVSRIEVGDEEDRLTMRNARDRGAFSKQGDGV